MTITTVKVSEKGQIAIPQLIREKMGVGKGDDLILIQVNGKIVLEKANNVEEKMKDEFKDILKYSELALRSVWDNKEDEIWGRYLKK